jgi:(p)ppGpp synthase/HD superfamily hydrolase
MHQQAEYGLAAHWRYKEGAYIGMATQLILPRQVNPALSINQAPIAQRLPMKDRLLGQDN